MIADLEDVIVYDTGTGLAMPIAISPDWQHVGIVHGTKNGGDHHTMERVGPAGAASADFTRVVEEGVVWSRDGRLAHFASGPLGVGEGRHLLIDGEKPIGPLRNTSLPRFSFSPDGLHWAALPTIGPARFPELWVDGQVVAPPGTEISAAEGMGVNEFRWQPAASGAGYDLHVRTAEGWFNASGQSVPEPPLLPAAAAPAITRGLDNPADPKFSEITIGTAAPKVVIRTPRSTRSLQQLLVDGRDLGSFDLILHRDGEGSRTYYHTQPDGRLLFYAVKNRKLHRLIVRPG